MYKMAQQTNIATIHLPSAVKSLKVDILNNKALYNSFDINPPGNISQEKQLKEDKIYTLYTHT